MRKGQRVSLIYIMLLLTVFVVGANASATTPKVYDEAMLFSQMEKEALEQRAVEISERLKQDIVIVTINDNQGKTSQEYADDFYDGNGFGYGENYDGLLLLINMDDREVYISTCGRAIQYFTDARIESILDNVYTYLADGNYSDGARVFLDEVEYYVEKGIPSNQYTQNQSGVPSSEREMGLGKRILIYLLISFGIGGISVGIMAINNKGKSSTNENTYLESNSFNIINSQDHHVNTTVTHVTINTNSGGSGKSTTHRSSSGRSHGGGGRKF